ncbi:MAG: S-layer homology domain-containing protein, partial [Nanoarchaeota archaeon]|nr:S-layer homology domain-containing protein [Nanoarchaeota archaeon]
ANITRAEGLAMIARFGKVKELKYINQFDDVTQKHWAATIISGAHTEGLLLYLKGKPFEPNRKLTRAEAVEMLYRSQPIKLLIADLINFDKGY